MKSINHIIITLLLFLVVQVSYGQNNPNQSYFLHTVESGQSLYSIATMYEVSQEDIIKMNPGSAEKIYAGQPLRIPQTISTEKKDHFHTIQPGETLYRLTVTYNIPAKTILDANPGLSANNFQAGKVILIPFESVQDSQPAQQVQPTIDPTVLQTRCREMHKVKRKETIYSLSREYGVSAEAIYAANPELKTEGLKRGSFLCIPYPIDYQQITPQPIQETTAPPTNMELFRQNRETSVGMKQIRAAIILPFIPSGDNRNESNRMVEYYEGFLMAVDSLKKTGVSIDLQVYDSGPEDASLEPVLNNWQLKNTDIIFGPLHTNHIQQLSQFADENRIRLVIPFSSKDNDVFNNPYIYQVNSPQYYMNPEVYQHFIREFPQANVIILDYGNEDKQLFIDGLRNEINNNQLSITTLPGAAPIEQLAAALRPDRKNIFIPTSGTDITLRKMLLQLEALLRDYPETDIQLFGYPEWQAYTKDFLNRFFALNTYFYSSFYANNLMPKANEFTRAYRRWYSKDMINTYPKYGMWGYDTALYFLKGLSQYGAGLDYNLNNIHYEPLQTGFKFNRVSTWGGFINRKVYFIHFSRTSEITRIDMD